MAASSSSSEISTSSSSLWRLPDLPLALRNNSLSVHLPEHLPYTVGTAA